MGKDGKITKFPAHSQTRTSNLLGTGKELYPVVLSVTGNIALNYAKKN